MKIRVLNPPAVEDKHGITEGREFEVLYEHKGRGGGVVVMGDAGEEVLLIRRRDEYEVIE